jgi:hypothetical protein
MNLRSAAAFAFAITVLALACQIEPDAPVQSDFISFSVSEPEGFYYEVRGDADHHQAGQTSQFQLNLTNPTQQDWNLRYCVLIVESNGMRTRIAQGAADASAGDSSRQTFEASIPSGLAEGAYGFAFVIPGSSAVVDTIWLGPKSGEEPSWNAPGLTTDPNCA